MATPDQVPPGQPPLLSARGIVMDFPGVRALANVDFSLRAGEIHALLGENGAGKSTLIKIFSGLHPPTAGSILLAGRELHLSSPQNAQSCGISTVFQEIDCLPQMSIADNICLCRQPTKFGLINHASVRRRAVAALARLELNLDITRALGDYPLAIQQMVSIARALDVDSKVLILDEPTSSLDADESNELFRVMRRLREQGLGIIFISHFLDHVYTIADRISVLRNGANIGTWSTPDLSRQNLIEAMTGRKIEHLPADRSTQSSSSSSNPAVLSVTNLSRSRSVEPTSVTLNASESLGLAGLLGSGRTELARLIFGADTPDRGSISIQHHSVPPGSIRDSIAAGIAFTPEDRKAEGLVLDLSVRENIILAMQSSRGALQPIPHSQQASLADHYIKSLNIRTPSPETPVRNLSGGNQQKVLLARWLAIQPKLLILDEPTRGIDVGARAEIESLIESLRKQGLAIIFISSELEEIVRTCTRVLVMRDHAAVADISTDINESNILSIIAAHNEEHKNGPQNEHAA